MAKRGDANNDPRNGKAMPCPCTNSRTTMLAHRSGQITIYIALALIILGLIGALYYLQRAQTEQILETGVHAISVSPEAQPMQDFLTDCLAQTATDGIKRLSERGGWIETPGRLNRQAPTQSDSVALAPGSDQAIAYWSYLSSPNDCTGTCTFSSLEPPLKKPGAQSIEQQLDSYIAAHFTSCLDGFSRFKSQGYSVSVQGPLTVSSTITPKTVAVFASYPVRFDKPGAAVTTNEIFTPIDARLGEMYSLADEITAAQKQYRFLEKHIRQLIDLQSGLGNGQLPPIYEVETGMSTGTTWSKNAVKEQIGQLMSTYTPFLQVFGTANYLKIVAPRSNKDPETFDRIYNRNMLIITSTEAGHPDLEARFQYLPWWTPYFDLNCQGDLCRPESLMNTLMVPTGPAIGIQKYQFAYKISAPIMVELRDPGAFSGQGLSFTFMLEANIRNNEPLEGDYSPIHLSSSVGEAGFCDSGQLTGRKISLTLLDGKTRLPVEGADMIYTCGAGNNENSTSCFIGRTSIGGGIETALPACIGGTISLLKSEYATSNIPFDSDEPGIQAVNLTLEPRRTIEIEILRKRIKKTTTGWELDPTVIPLDPYEESYISLQRVPGQFDEEFIAAGQQIGDPLEDAKSGSHKDIPMIPGNYSIEISTILRPGQAYVIPVDHRCYEGECVDVPKEPITFDSTKPLPLGGAVYQFEIRKDDLDRSAKLQVFAIDVGLDLIPESERKAEDLEMIGDIEGLTKPYQSQITPKWVGR